MFRQFLLYIKVAWMWIHMYLLFSIAFRISVLLFSSLILMVSFLLLTLEVFWFFFVPVHLGGRLCCCYEASIAINVPRRPAWASSHRF